MPSRKSPLDDRLKRIDRDLLSVQDRIRALSKEEPCAAGFERLDAARTAEAPPNRCQPEAGEEEQRKAGLRDSRLADYLASGLEARQPLNVERRTRRNKVIFIAAIAAAVLIVWALSKLR